MGWKRQKSTEKHRSGKILTEICRPRPRIVKSNLPVLEILNFTKRWAIRLAARMLMAVVLLWVATSKAQSSKPFILTESNLAHINSLSDSQIASLANTLQSMPTVSPQIPSSMTGPRLFYSLDHPDWPAFPLKVSGAPVWQIGSNSFLMNDLYLWTNSSASNAGYSIQTNRPSAKFAGKTNLLLELTNVEWGWTWLNLHNATNMVYEVLSKTNLMDPQWTVEQELWSTNPISMPFYVSQLGRSKLYLRVMDWSDVYHSGNVTPDWWLWFYFGTMQLTDTNLDADGNTLAYDYANNILPRVYSFHSVETTNFYVATSTPQLSLNVTGYPYYFAVLVDDTDTQDAIWTMLRHQNMGIHHQHIPRL